MPGGISLPKCCFTPNWCDEHHKLMAKCREALGNKQLMCLVENWYKIDDNYVYPDGVPFVHLASMLSKEASKCFTIFHRTNIIYTAIEKHFMPGVENTLVNWDYNEACEVFTLSQYAIINDNYHAYLILHKLGRCSANDKMCLVDNISTKTLDVINNTYPFCDEDLIDCIDCGSLDIIIKLLKYVDIRECYKNRDFTSEILQTSPDVLDYFINSEYSDMITYPKNIDELSNQQIYNLLLHDKLSFSQKLPYKVRLQQSCIHRDSIILEILFDLHKDKTYYTYKIPIELYSIIFSYFTNYTYSYKKIVDQYDTFNTFYTYAFGDYRNLY